MPVRVEGMRPTIGRLGLAITALLAIVVYTVAVVAGIVPKDSKIDAVHLAMIIVGALTAVVLLNPSVLERINSVEFKGVKIALIERLQERQAQQENQLQDVKLLIPLLFPEPERKHLINLARGNTTGCRGGGSLREELRRLRSIGLIRTRNNHAVGELRSEMTFDLAEYVELTDLGRRWVQRLADLEFATLDTTDDKVKPN